MRINGQHYDTHVVEYSKLNARIIVNDIEYSVEFDNEDPAPKQQQIVLVNNTIPVVPEIKQTAAIGKDVKAPIPGTIASINVKEGEIVTMGQLLFTLEAMKMESEIVAPADGTVEKIFVKDKVSVQEGDVLLRLIG